MKKKKTAITIWIALRYAMGDRKKNPFHSPFFSMVVEEEEVEEEEEQQQ